MGHARTSSVTYTRPMGTQKLAHTKLKWGLLVVIEGINYEWVEPIIINYLLIASTLSSCYHCGCVGMCVSNHLGQGVVGGDFNWSSAAGGPSGESFTVKSLRVTKDSLL